MSKMRRRTHVLRIAKQRKKKRALDASNKAKAVWDEAFIENINFRTQCLVKLGENLREALC